MSTDFRLTAAERQLIEALRRSEAYAAPDPKRRPKLWQYARRSSIDGAGSGLSQPVQLEQMGVCTARLVAEWGGAVDVVEPLVDTSVRAHSVPFRRREAGSVIWKGVQPGDAIVIARLDRAFCSMADMVSSVCWWSERNIAVHFAKDGDTGFDGLNRLSAPMLAAFARCRSALMSVKMKEVAAELRLRGRPNGQPRMWEEYRGRRGHKIRVTRPEIWRVVVTIYVAHERHGWKFTLISDVIEALRARDEGREMIPRALESARPFPARRCRRAYRHLKGILPNEPELCQHLADLVASDVPLDAIHRYCPPPVGRSKPG